MIKFLKQLFVDSFVFDHDRFENLFFKKFNIQYSILGYNDEHWIYKDRDILYKVNIQECIVYLNGTLLYRVEFIHNMEYNSTHLFEVVHTLY